MTIEKFSTDSHLYRVIDKVIPGNKDSLLRRLKDGEKLNIKFGTDPTGRDMHFGHAVNLWVLRYMQEIGHKVDLIIGDATASIGDPTGRNLERPQLDEDAIQANADKFLDQATKVLINNPEVLKVHRNSAWFKDMDALSFIHRVLRPITLSKLTERNTFKSRIEKGEPIHAHELVYQLLQGYDSVYLKTDIAVCGDDQLTNEMMGRDLQSHYKQEPQSILTTKITLGTDGKGKQSKTAGNYIGLNHSAAEQYRRIMSIPDSLIKDYFDIYTDLASSEIVSVIADAREGVRGLKKKLAKEMLKRYHVDQTIGEAEESYERSASKSIPIDAPCYIVGQNEIDLLDFAKANFALSKSQFRNLVKGGAVSINGKKLDATNISTDGRLLVEVSSAVEVKYGQNKWAILKK